MSAPRTVAFHTLGCKLNYSETSSIGRLFEQAGYLEIGFEDGADVYVINTCSVTDFADKTCRNMVRRAMKFNPQAYVVVIGCYAQLKPKEIASIPGVDLVLGAAQKFRILDYIDDLSKSHAKGMVHAGEVAEAKDFVSSFSFGDRTRSFLKVQDGCNYSCSFCTIPLARGASRSDTVERVLENAKKIAASGVKEIVLTGVNLGDFGNGTEVIEGARPRKEALFADLIKQLDEVEGVERYRISSIEPNLLTDEIIEFVAKSKHFMPHFHVPLQSGSNKILAAMRRRYKRELYASRVESIKQQMPHACIGVDVIVGFPGETEEDFMDTYHFLKDLDISYLHVFTYSERPNTPAAEMADQVPMQVRKKRNEMLRILSEKKKRQFYEQHMSSTRTALIERRESEDGLMTGFTDNYVKISLPYDDQLVNQLIEVELLSFDKEGNIDAKVSPSYVAG